MNISTNNFVYRQHSTSRFSHFDGTPEEVIELVKENWDSQEPGYRDGVVLVSVPVDRFYSGVVELEEGQPLFGSFVPRKKDEDPEKVIVTGSRDKLKAGHVQVVVYKTSVLAEDDDNCLPNDDPDNWEIVSINASPTDGPLPITPSALMRNHFGGAGGTATNMTSEEFVSTLKEAWECWKSKAMCG
jgi:hypothetical protein